MNFRVRYASDQWSKRKREERIEIETIEELKAAYETACVPLIVSFGRDYANTVTGENEILVYDDYIE